MIAFAFLAMLMTAGCVFALAYPLLRGTPTPAANRAITAMRQSEHSLRVHRERLARLDQAVADGELSAQQAQEEKDDLARALLEDAPELVDDETAPRPDAGLQAQRSRHRSWLLAAAVAVVLPLASAAFYAQSQLDFWHSQNAARGASALAGPNATATPAAQASDVDRPLDPAEMVARLEARLEREPNDGAGWRLLGRSYFTMGQADKAVDAYARAHRLLGDQVDLLVEYAEAESVRDGYRFSSSVAQRLERALQLQPDHSKALMLGGVSALQSGDKITAQRRIARALAAFPADSDQAKAINALAERAGLQLAGAQGSSPASDPITANPALEVEISLAAPLRVNISGNERVFVFARAEKGPPMPLAVRELPASALPATISLSDSDSMMSGVKLSSATSVVVGARLSRSGSATPSAGDLEGSSGPLAIGSGTTVKVLIDRVRP